MSLAKGTDSFLTGSDGRLEVPRCVGQLRNSRVVFASTAPPRSVATGFLAGRGSGGGARPGVDATRVSAGSRSAVELVEACFEAPYGAVDIGELVEAEESDAE